MWFFKKEDLHFHDEEGLWMSSKYKYGENGYNLNLDLLIIYFNRAFNI